MANDLVVKLLLKTGAFSQDLKTAKGQVQDFQKGCKTAGDSVKGFSSALGLNVGSLTKFGTAAGAAMLAGKEFKAVMDSSQTTSDAFKESIEGAKGVIEAFNTALATGDFSSFRNGIWDIISASKDLQKALDQLGNTQFAFDFLSKKNITGFNDAYNIYKDPESTQEMKDAALNQMKEVLQAQENYVKNYANKALDAYKKAVVKKAGAANLREGRVTEQMFIDAMNIDLSDDPEKMRATINRQYEEYTKKLKEYGKNNIAAQEELKRTNASVIAIHAMLELMKDDELKGLGEILGNIETARQQAQSMRKQLNRVSSSSTKTTSSTPTSTPTGPTAESGSVAELKASISLEQKKLDEMRAGTDEWKKQYDIVVALNKALDEELEKIAAITTVQVQQVEEVTETMSESIERLSGTVKVPNIWSVSELQAFIKEIQNLRDSVPVMSEEFAILNELLAKYNDTLDTINGKSSNLDTSASKWDDFGDAMANTSTIVTNLGNSFKNGADKSAAAILSMVATTLPAIGQLISSISALAGVEAVEAGVAGVGKAVSTSKHWIEAIAAVAAVSAAVASAISASKSAGKFANGGIVGGTSFSGDRLTANVNSGEMILNRAQQGNLWKQINNGGGAGEVTFHISGTDLVGTLNNYNRKSSSIR